MTKILVTGGTGFIGSHLVSRLEQRGHQVVALSRSAANYVSNGRVEYVAGDFSCPQDVVPLLHDVDVIYHLAVTTNPGNSNNRIEYDAQTNLMGTLSLLEQAVAVNIRRFIFVSSGGSVYGPNGGTPIPEDHTTQPISAHGVSKLAAEKYLEVYHRIHGLEYRIARVANPYGERQDPDRGQGLVASILGRLARQEEIVVWGDGSVVRDYLYVGDVVSALELMLSDEGDHTTYNVGSGNGHSVNEMISLLSKFTDCNAKVRYEAARPADVPFNSLDISRIHQELGWEPQTNLATGIAHTWAWVCQHYLMQDQLIVGVNVTV